MPAAILHQRNKRKRETENAETSAQGPVDGQEPAESVLPGILLLEKGILESRKNYNSIATLLEYMRAKEAVDGEDTVAAVALYRVFCRLLALGYLTRDPHATESDHTVVSWLRERLQEYEETLLDHLQSPDLTKQVATLTLLMRLVKEKAKQAIISDTGVWHSGLFKKIVQGLIVSRYGEPVMDEFVEKFATKYADVRHYTFACISDTSSDDDFNTTNALYMISKIEPVSEGEVDDEYLFIKPAKHKKLYAGTAHKKQAQKAWLSVLRQPLDKAQRKKVLDLISHLIAPWFLKVEMLMDFLTDAFDVGGSTSLMALSGLFYLITQKNLDYPQFYTKLYSLLDSHILHSKHRSRFFRLLDTCLASTHLPAGLVASFIKRLSRLCLFAPPAGIVIVVPFVYNLLQNHRSCTFMIHRIRDVPKKATSHWGDPFMMEEPDPMETNAFDSSLWELYSLQSHYHPNVAALAKIISEQFTKQSYNLEDFLDHSYSTMLQAELSKDLKKDPEIEYEIPKKIFTRHDPGSGQEDSLLVKLWDFEQ